MADNANTGGGRGVKRGGFDWHCCFILLLFITACIIAGFVLVCLFVPMDSLIFSIEDYSVRANKSQNFRDTTFFLDLKVGNENTFMGVYYDEINLTLHRLLDYTIVGSTTCPGFYQGHSKSTHLSVEVRRLVWNGSGEVFLVNLETEYRRKIGWWKTQRRHFDCSMDVKVNRFGLKVVDDDTHLTSASPEEHGGFHARLMIILCCSLGLII